MWSEETIKKKLNENLLPCARCHKWEPKENFKKNMKVCNNCLTSWKERQKQLAQEKDAIKTSECSIV